MKGITHRSAPKQPRTRCRLPCVVQTERNRIRARVLDVSEGGLCIVTPVRFRNQARVQIVIDDPRRGPVAIEGVVRHDRPYKTPSSGRKGFATGLVLAKGGADFRALSHPAAARPAPPPRPRPAARPLPRAVLPTPSGDRLDLDVGGPSVYRVKARAVGSPRSRTLLLTAISEAAAREAALADLPGEWEVIEVEADPLD